MKAPFEEALAELLAEYAGEDPDELISSMELALIVLKEEADG